jgi:hypothetical protein
MLFVASSHKGAAMLDTTSTDDLRHALSRGRDEHARVSSGSFAALQDLDPYLAITANDAEALRDWPRYSLMALRGWLEYLLAYLEHEHSIPKAELDRGELKYRINRLPEHDVNISGDLKKALDDIRIYSNGPAHPVGKERFFTLEYADEALDKARSIRDWLRKQYLSPAAPTEGNFEIAHAPQGDTGHKSAVQEGVLSAGSQFLPMQSDEVSNFPNQEPIVRASRTSGRRYKGVRRVDLLVGFFDCLIVIAAIVVLNAGPHNQEKASNATLPITPAVSHRLDTPETVLPPIPTNPGTAPGAPSGPHKRVRRVQ